MSSKEINTIDNDEVEKFSAIADEWWDEEGKFRPLHQINPIRIKYIKSQIEKHLGAKFSGYKLLDVGCGGGLISVPMAKIGFTVDGVDASEKNIMVARAHAKKHRIKNLEYMYTSVEHHAEKNLQKYDVILALEVLEHVAEINNFIHALKQMLKPGGVLIISTINKTIKSLLLAKIAAEYILHWVPVGTHSWHKFLRPADLKQSFHNTGLDVVGKAGMVYNPLAREWKIGRSMDVNYFMVMQNTP
ncbi:MAG: bifunctional 2-polyprenyl-6-hydroxyphenol methylase/3-demethylubiquinol 3-O-methyltransferase UbiG [Rickettsiales bacterium]